MATNLQIALIVGDDEGLKIYSTRLAVEGVTLIAFKSIQEFAEAPKKENLFAGVVLDMKTALKATANEKQFLTDVIEVQMPIAKFSRPSLNDAVADKILRTQWETFRRECTNFNPRGMRTYPRKSAVLKISLCATELWQPGSAIRAVTGDLSVGGCFIVSSEAWVQGKNVSFLLGESPDPIVGLVKWIRPWGASLWQMPGLGVEFGSLNGAQKAALVKVLDVIAKGG